MEPRGVRIALGAFSALVMAFIYLPLLVIVQRVEDRELADRALFDALVPPRVG
jgi:hypothetical protein